MKRRKRRRQEKMEVLQLWTYPQANRALPYIRSVATSLRDNWLDAQGKRVRASRMGNAPGKPTRQDILATKSAEEEQGVAYDRFNDTLKEMLGMHVFPIDAAQGLALIPFRKEDELAWFVFDLFDQAGLPSWRYHRDPLEKRRPINEVENQQGAESVPPELN